MTRCVLYDILISRKRKGETAEMDENIMTDKQLKIILKMVAEIIKESDTKEEAEKKIEELIQEYND